jgi:hypothetical protein
MLLFLPFLLYASFITSQEIPSQQTIGSTAKNASEVIFSSDQEWPISELGTILEPQAPDAELLQMLSEIDPSRVKNIIEKLVSFGTRHTLSSQTDPKRGIGAARDWIASEMRGYAANSGGNMVVSVPGYTQPKASRIPFPVRISNVVARLQGSSDPSRVYVITGHYDSRNTNDLNYVDDAPGANDDASGVAVVMELCRIMASKRPAATIIFGAVAGEEQNLFGSTFLAQSLKNASTDVQAMLNNDIVGSSTGDRGQKDPYTVRLFAQGVPTAQYSSRQLKRLLDIGGENDSPTRQLARFAHDVASNAATGMQIAIIYRLDRYGRGGDHSSFLQMGYPAVRFTEPNENFAHQHQDVRVERGLQYGDLPEFVDYEYVARVAKVNLATLWSLAQSPGRVPGVRLDSAVLGNESRLTWRRPRTEGGLRFEVVWRPTTAPYWTHVVAVGDVTAVTLQLSKDNVIFGVRAVGRNGHRGVVTIPGLP